MTAVENKRTNSRCLSIPSFSRTMWHDNEGTMSKERVVKKNSTIIEKMIDIHLEQTEKNNDRYGPFIKCNYIEELVEKENLNYLTLRIYPSKLFFFIKNPDMQQYFLNMEKNEDEELLDYIDNEEIPSSFVALLDRYDWRLMYDYHIILQIQKFSADEEGNSPLFYTFVLLRPTDKVHTHYIAKGPSSEDKKIDRKKRELQNKHESVVLFETCPPLYLGTDQTALDITYLQGCYGNILFVNRKYISKPNANHDNIEFLENEMSLQPREPSVEKFCRNKEIGSYYVGVKEELHSVLVSRKINSDNLKINCQILVEVFYFELKEEDNSNKLINDQISVYMKNGLFCISESIFDVKSTHLFCVGSRNELDMYIFTFAETVSEKFCKRICIKHKNCLDEKSSLTSIFHWEEKVFGFEDKCRSTAVEMPGIGVTINKNATINHLGSTNMTQEYIRCGISRGQTDSQKLNRQDRNTGASIITEFQAQKRHNKNRRQSFSTNTEKRTELDFTSHIPIFKCTKEDLWSI